MSEHLLLKWGTLKGWRVESKEAYAALNDYAHFGMSGGAMQWRDSEEQQRALIKLIDVIEGPITNDWSGEQMTKEDAKKYVLEYRS